MSTKSKEKKVEVLQTDLPKEFALIDEIQQELDKRLEMLAHKQKLAKQRTLFLTTKEKIERFKTALEEEENDLFQTEQFKIQFTNKENYRDESAFSISNPPLIFKFLNVLDEEISSKVKALERELLT